MLRIIAWLQRFLASWRFPAFVASLLLSFCTVMLVMLVVPAPRGLEAFADEFRVWCFGYDPQKKTVEWMYVLMTIGEPFGLACIISAIWWKQLRGILRERPRALVPYTATALAIVLAAQTALFAFGRDARAAGPLEFPAKSLRTAIDEPALVLTDQNGERFDLGEQRGRVVVVTGVYSTCGATCPMIMGQAKRAIARLTPIERQDVRVAAITLDPEHDDQAHLDAMARGQSAPSPTFHFLWGDPQTVNNALDAFSIERTRDASGRIDHANLFVLIDRKGKIAYRLTLGPDQERWLLDAMRTLIAEREPG